MARGGKRPGAGRKPGSATFKPEYMAQAEKLAKLGATDREIAEFFDVNERTVYRWQHEFPDFSRALKLGKDEADNRVEKSLYRRAVGYSFDSEKIITVSQGQGLGAEVERHPIVEHVPPDVTACIFWLKNRRPGLWRDKREMDVTQHQSPLDDLDAATLRALVDALRASTPSPAPGSGTDTRH